MEPNVPSSAEDSLYSHLLGRFPHRRTSSIAETRFRLLATRRAGWHASIPEVEHQADVSVDARTPVLHNFCMTPLRHGTPGQPDRPIRVLD